MIILPTGQWSRIYIVVLFLSQLKPPPRPPQSERLHLGESWVRESEEGRKIYDFARLF